MKIKVTITAELEIDPEVFMKDGGYDEVNPQDIADNLMSYVSYGNLQIPDSLVHPEKWGLKNLEWGEVTGRKIN